MKQSRAASLMESVINIAVGFGISLAAQATLLPLIGVAISFHQNLIFAVLMTVVSIARSYLLRRLFEALHIRVPLSPFMLAVIAERRRQIEVEGWTVEHDDGHQAGELAKAGAAYADHAGSFHDAAYLGTRYAVKAPPGAWPWSREWWKPVGFRRDLVKAGALIIAEGERFDRSRKAAVTPMPLPDRAEKIRRRHPRHFGLAHGKTPAEHGGASA